MQNVEVCARERKHIQALSAVTSRFYQCETTSFSQTRLNGWEGWRTVEEHLAAFMSSSAAPVTLFDLGCGNLRFERSCAATLRGARIHAFDNCTPLTSAQPVSNNSIELHIHRFDLVEGLLAYLQTHAVPPQLLQASSPQALVCFGVMHHLPTQHLRRAYMRLIGDLMGAHGWIALSFWRFLDDDKLSAKAACSHDAALQALDKIQADIPPQEVGLDPQLTLAYSQIVPSFFEAGDRLLGWRDAARVMRFCHSFSTDEIDDLEATLIAHLPAPTRVHRFLADGKRRPLNEYLICSW